LVRVCLGAVTVGVYLPEYTVGGGAVTETVEVAVVGTTTVVAGPVVVVVVVIGVDASTVMTDESALRPTRSRS
jgi:hypothetical protein